MGRHSIIPIGIVSIVTLFCAIEAQVCSQYGFFCNSCSTVQICSSGIPSAISLSCPVGTYCDQTSAAVCTATECTSEPYPFYDCQVEGRFAWPSNCNQYIWCAIQAGTLVPTLLNCPSTTVFNPNTETCVLATTYNCVDQTTLEPVTESATTTESTTVTSTTSIETTTLTTSTTTITPEDTTVATQATTTSTAATSTPSATTTTTDIPTTTTTTTTTAPTTTTSTTTPTTTTSTTTPTTTTSTTTTTTPTPTTTSTTTTTTTAAPFTCQIYGRFEITTDVTCQSYYFCYPNSDGTFTMLTMVCPTTTLFNPQTSTCVLPTAYTCTR